MWPVPFQTKKKHIPELGIILCIYLEISANLKRAIILLPTILYQNIFPPFDCWLVNYVGWLFPWRNKPLAELLILSDVTLHSLLKNTVKLVFLSFNMNDLHVSLSNASLKVVTYTFISLANVLKILYFFLSFKIHNTNFWLIHFYSLLFFKIFTNLFL